MVPVIKTVKHGGVALCPHKNTLIGVQCFFFFLRQYQHPVFSHTHISRDMDLIYEIIVRLQMQRRLRFSYILARQLRHFKRRI